MNNDITPRYWYELGKGGHLAALECPEAFTSEVRAAFRAFRSRFSAILLSERVRWVKVRERALA